MVKTIEINGEKYTAIVLDKESFVEINDYRKAIYNMFELAALFNEFDSCIDKGEMWTILRFIKALGLPYDKDFPEDQFVEEMKFFALEHPDSKIKDLFKQMEKKGGKI